MDSKFVEETLAKLADNPQRVSAAQHAFGTIASGIAELAKLGVNVEMAGASAGASPGTEYPKMLVSDKIAPYELQVNSSKEELEATAKGWKSLLPPKKAVPPAAPIKPATAPARPAAPVPAKPADDAESVGEDDTTG